MYKHNNENYYIWLHIVIIFILGIVADTACIHIVYTIIIEVDNHITRLMQTDHCPLSCQHNKKHAMAFACVAMFLQLSQQNCRCPTG